MKKILILAISLFGTLTLTGCASSGSIKGEISCPSNDGCEARVTGTVSWKSSDSSYDFSHVRLNISQSTIDVTSNSGTMILSVKSQNATKGATVINWYKNGNYIYVSNPSAANTWLSNIVVNDDQIIMDVTGINFNPKIGENAFTAVYEYDSNPIMGASDSFYLNKADLNGF